jgi:hypothetical protein
MNMTRKTNANNAQTEVNEMTEQVDAMNENVDNGNKEMNENVETKEENVSAEFEIDPSLLSEEFNCRRPKRFPYGIVINEENAGLFIPEKNLAKAGWLGTPEIVEKELSGGVESGLFMTNARMIILGSVRPYLRYKDTDETPAELRGVMIGWYDEYAEEINKKTMDAVSEHLVMFVNFDNNFLHETPIRIRFKNVALWSLLDALEQYYSEFELTFARVFKLQPSSKNERWRALCVVDLQFQGVKEGEGRNKSFCCKVGGYVKPNLENFPALFMGTKTKMTAVLEKYDTSLGFDETVKALLPAPTKLALPES